MEVLFSFGTSEQYPFQGGYIIINAANYNAALQEFRRHFPDRNPHIFNCADIYYDYYAVKEFKENGNLGAGCHWYIDLLRDKNPVIGRMNYLSADCRSSESREYTDLKQFIDDCNEAVDDDTPIDIMIYRDKDGLLAPREWAEELNVLVDIVDSPYLLKAKMVVESSPSMTKRTINAMQAAAFESLKESMGGTFERMFDGGLTQFSIYRIADAKKAEYIPIQYKTQINACSLSERGFDINNVEIIHLCEVNRQTKQVYFNQQRCYLCRDGNSVDEKKNETEEPKPAQKHTVPGI